MSIYQFIWRVRTADPLKLVRLQPVTIDGKMGADSIIAGDGEIVTITGPFGTDLCVVGGWAEIEHITNAVDESLICTTPVYFADKDCHGNEIDHGDEP